MSSEATLRKLVDPSKLGQAAAMTYEAELFTEKHPEFFGSGANRKIMLDYMNNNKIPWTTENLEKAFEDLKARGELFSPEQSIATMSAQELAQMSYKYGEAKYDSMGNFLGWEWPSHMMKPAGYSYGKRQKGAHGSTVRPLAMGHPEDLERKPSRKEWAQWGADRTREYLEAKGLWEKPFLPKDFFRD
jgi:hypothetical protein